MIELVEVKRGPRVLWLGDAVVSTGFARCTHAVCDELHRAGWDVHVLGINYFGDPHDYPYPVYPCYQPQDDVRDSYGVTRLPKVAGRVDPDVIVLLQDPWNVPEYTSYFDQYVEGVRKKSPAQADKLASIPMVGWMAVDALHQDGKPLNRLDRVSTWTEFAASELRQGGYNGFCDVVPLGVDHDQFYPVDRARAREKVLPEIVPRDAFVVGVVGRNQPRKRLDLTLSYFADWIKSDGIDDAYLMLHVAPTGEKGVDLLRLLRYYGLGKKVILSNPEIGFGASLEFMRDMYSAIDVYWTTTQGEGWGLPALEAMACGTPVLAPDWSALGDWARPAAVLVPCNETAISAPTNRGAYTIGGIPDRRETLVRLQMLYDVEDHRRERSAAGLELAAKYPWSRSVTGMRGVLESVLRARKEETVGGGRIASGESAGEQERAASVITEEVA